MPTFLNNINTCPWPLDIKYQLFLLVNEKNLLQIFGKRTTANQGRLRATAVTARAYRCWETVGRSPVASSPYLAFLVATSQAVAIHHLPREPRSRRS
ncbi:hypothetical protein L484_010169 [Morus notabilis]|uniref:Uncharacterized protein n=1 Tax=Morus notabilis TaxID=981085 RepID=W9RY95_9ROSA|nr:hypothetical protein L484_010169 [Morus notabilis]